MAELEPLAPLEPDSTVAGLLYEIWSGKRIVNYCFDRTRMRDESEAVSTIVSHLHRRAGFKILVIGGPEIVEECILRLEPLLLPDSLASASPYLTGCDPSITASLVIETLASIGGEGFKPSDYYDLVILVSGADDDPSNIYGGLVFGKQLLVLTRWIGQIGLNDQVISDMPVDVALAGGVDR